jgi:SP family arabinose:H+ symporter-like MFS transporter
LGIVASYFTNYFLQQFAEQQLVLIAAGNPGLTGFFRTIFVDEVWRAMFGTGILPSILFIIVLLFVPRSPRWLVMHGRDGDARTILMRLTSAAESEREINDIHSVLQMERGSIWELFSAKYRRPLLIGILLPFFGQVSGINAIIYYGPSIFAEADIDSSNALSGQALIGLVNMLMTFVAIALVDRFGRRPLLIAGTVGILTALISAAALLSADKVPVSWLIPVFLLHVGCFAFSLGPCVWIVISEIFPTRIRSEAMSIATLIVWITCVMVGQFFPVLVDSFGPATVFLIFAALVAPALPFSIFLLPETKNRSLEEIERSWASL